MNLVHIEPMPNLKRLIHIILTLIKTLVPNITPTSTLCECPFLPLCAVLSRSVMSNSLRPYGLKLARLLCPRGFFRQEYRSGLPCPPPRHLPNPGIGPRSPALQADPLSSEPPGSPFLSLTLIYKFDQGRMWRENTKNIPDPCLLYFPLWSIIMHLLYRS